jgi:hypothetical protein
MRRHLPLFLSMLSFILLPLLVHASTFTGPIDPSSTLCGCAGNEAPDYGCVLILIQNLMNFFIYFATLVITMYIAMAGFAYMTSGGNPEKHGEANKRILNAVIGLMIVLGAWLIVNSVMSVLYQKSSFGDWNSILSAKEASNCIKGKPTPPLPGLSSASNAGGGDGASAGGPPAPSGGGKGPACSPLAVQQAAAAGGVTMSSSEASTLACIANPESGCGALNQNYNWNGAKDPSNPSTAWGPFQITLKGNSACYDNSACQKAAGVSGSLNCRNAFDSHGDSIPGALLTECQTASQNLSCSTVAADCIVKANHGTYRAWTGNSDSTPIHQQCVAANAGT